MLSHALKLARRHLLVHHELLVAELKSISLQYLLLLRRQSVHHFVLVVD